MKKFLALLTAFSLLFVFTACGKNSGGESEVNGTTAPQTNAAGDPVTDAGTETQPTETDTSAQENSTGEESSTQQGEAEQETSALPTNPKAWSKEQIVEFYKKAAIKSKKAVTSKQEMTLASMVVNNGDGVLGTFVEMITPILKAALKSNSTEFDGITGGYENIVPSDIKTAKAYKSGKYTVVEMTMVEQTDGIHGDTFSGTVGHAISVVGNISAVADALPQFNIDFDNADLKLHYSNPKLRVKINQNGIIEKGTWTYTVDVKVANLHIEAIRLPIAVTVDSAYGKVDYIITTGGGF